MFSLITTSELKDCGEKELGALFNKASEALTKSDAHSPARRNALASLENIARARRTMRF